MLGTLLLGLSAVPGALGYQLHPRDIINKDPYPFCNTATNPNCIADGKYLVPILDFSLQRSAGDKAYASYLPTTEYTLSQWPKGKMPRPCYYWGVERDRWNAADFTIYNVTYTDCGMPWVVCLNKKVPRTIKQIAKVRDEEKYSPIRGRGFSQVYRRSAVSLLGCAWRLRRFHT